MITPHISPPQHQYLPCLSLSESIRTYQRKSDTLRLIPIGSDKLRYPPNNMPPAPYRTICSLERTSAHASAHLCPQTDARAAQRLRTCLLTPPHQHAHRCAPPFQLQRTYAPTAAHFRPLTHARAASHLRTFAPFSTKDAEQLYVGNGAELPCKQIVAPTLSDVRRYLGKVYRVFSDRTIQTIRYLSIRHPVFFVYTHCYLPFYATLAGRSAGCNR